VVLNFTTGGAPTMTIEERLQPALQLKPEVASLNMGSMNFGLYEMLGRYKEFKHGWEQPYLAGSDDRIFKNTFKDIAYILQSCATTTRASRSSATTSATSTPRRTSSSAADEAAAVHPVGVRHPRRHRPHPEDVIHMKRTADRLFGDAYYWSVLGAGRNQMTSRRRPR
jgi:uncharacterized protein (DUF849 family)